MYKEILDPLIDKKILITEDGTSQTRLSNTGRFGFYVERLFGIRPNNSQSPDHILIGEIKTIKIKGNNFGSCSIGTISQDNWHDIASGQATSWRCSPPFRKMKQTLFVFYVKDTQGPDPVYQIKKYVLIDFERIGEYIESNLEADYQAIRKRMIRSRGYGCCNFAHLANLYLSAGSKGDSCYVYPSFSFKPRLLKAIYNAKPIAD